MSQLAVIHVDTRKVIYINPLTECRRCGAEAAGEGGEPGFRICILHCAGCEETSQKPNPLDDWMTPDARMFKAPICNSCYQDRCTRRDGVWTTGKFS